MRKKNPRISVRYSHVPNQDSEVGQPLHPLLSNPSTNNMDFSSAFEYETETERTQKYRRIFFYKDVQSIYGVARCCAEAADYKPSRITRYVGNVAVALSYLLFVISLPVSVFTCIKTIKENEKAVVFRLGRLHGAKGPGCVLILPCVDHWKRVGMHTRAFNIPPIQMITADRGIIEVGALVHYRIEDAVQATTAVQDLDHATRTLALTLLQNVLRKKDVSEIDQGRQIISHFIQMELNQTVNEWGLTVEQVIISELKVLQQPTGMQSGIQAFLNSLSSSHVCMPPGLVTPSQLLASSQQMSGGAGASSVNEPKQPSVLSDLLNKVKGSLNETLVRSVGATFLFQIQDGDEQHSFLLDLKRGGGSIEKLSGKVDVDTTLMVALSDLDSMTRGKLLPFQAYMTGRLQISGNLKLAMKLDELLTRTADGPPAVFTNSA